MCSRFSLTAPQRILRRFPRFTSTLSQAPRYNIAPQQDVLGACGDAPAELRTMRWGLTAPWVRDEKGAFSAINARAETIAEKPMYREAFRARRCLVFADGFYEWRTNAFGKKQPVRFRLRDGAPFAFAGIYEDRVREDGAELRTCAIATTMPNAVAAAVHDRMPVMLAESAFDLWLDPGVDDVELLRSLLRPYPADEMERFDVSPALSNVRNEGAHLIEPYDEPEPLALF